MKLQKKCLRIITFSSYLEHTEPLFQDLEILNIKQLVIHRIAMLMFKNSKEMVPIAIRRLFARNDQYHNYNTTCRQCRSVHPSDGKGEAIYRSFSHGVNIWNYLSKHISTNVSYNRFNKLTKSYLLKNNTIIDLYSTMLFSIFVYFLLLMLLPHTRDIFCFVYYYEFVFFSCFFKIWCWSLFY